MWVSVARPKKMQIKGLAWGAAASSEVWAAGKGDGSPKRMSGCSQQLHYANQWFRRNKAGSSGLPLSITPGLFHLAIFQVACTTHLSNKQKLGRYFLFLVPSKSFCLLFRELPVLYYSPARHHPPFPDAGFWPGRLFTHHVWQMLTLKTTLLLQLLVSWSQETSVPKWQMDFRPISYAITKTQNINLASTPELF